MQITDEMVEAACAAYHGDWCNYSKGSKGHFSECMFHAVKAALSAAPQPAIDDMTRRLAEALRNVLGQIDGKRGVGRAMAVLAEYDALAAAPAPTTEDCSGVRPVSPGWKLVPVELTREMHQNGINAVIRQFGPADIYRAMLAAAPEPPQQAPAEPGPDAVAWANDDFYGDGSRMHSLRLHPDPSTNAEIIIGALCARLDTARQALAAAAAMQVVQPALATIKGQRCVGHA